MTKTSALPAAFVEAMRPLLGDERWQRFMDAMNEEPPVSVRLNPKKGVRPVASATAVPWCRDGYWLPGRPAFTFDPMLHAGCYYVQEAGSMAIAHVVQSLGLEEPVACLDLCAAPGGKSTLLCATLPEGSTVLSNEPLHQRAQVLAENVAKWGYAGSHVTCCYPADYCRTHLLFDLILCDAPCSGEGMFRKEADAITTWSPRKVADCAALQRDILTAAWQLLRPGGTLIYSTCTYNIYEDEEQLLWLISSLGAEPLPLMAHPSWGCLPSLAAGSLPVLRFMPGFTQSEGLFVCAVKKPGQGCATPTTRLLQTIGKRLTLIEMPVLAVKDAPIVDVDYRTALCYLRGEAVALSPDVPRGPVSIAYGGHVLGAAKNLGNRANNLYPKPWRIKSTHLPELPPEVVL